MGWRRRSHVGIGSRGAWRSVVGSVSGQRMEIVIGIAGQGHHDRRRIGDLPAALPLDAPLADSALPIG